MKKFSSQPVSKASLPEVLLIVLITNLREWLPIKSASINKLALQFERLVSSRWTVKPLGLCLEERDDGIGAQLHGQISIIVQSRKCGIPYAHRDIDHAAFIKSEAELVRWVKAFNFEAHNDLDENDKAGAETISLLDYVRWPFRNRQRCLIEAPHMHNAAEKDPDFYFEVCQDLRSELTLGTSTIEPVDRPIRVALHVRRGDVSCMENKKRFTSLEEVKQSIIALVQTLKACDANFSIELHSQGNEADFEDLMSIHPMQPYLDSDPLETMERLIKADILLMAKSSFSQIAALMSEGIVLYEPYWQKPLLHWHVRQPDGSIDGKLKDAIDQRVAKG